MNGYSTNTWRTAATAPTATMRTARSQQYVTPTPCGADGSNLKSGEESLRLAGDTQAMESEARAASADSAGAASEAADAVAAASGVTAAAFKDGLLGVLTPMVAQCDEGVQSALDSQTALSQQLDRVARELQAFLGSSQIPSLSPYAQKLADVRQRLTVANATLLQVQARLAKIEAVAEKLQRAGVATPRFSSSNELR